MQQLSLQQLCSLGKSSRHASQGARQEAFSSKRTSYARRNATNVLAQHISSTNSAGYVDFPRLPLCAPLVPKVLTLLRLNSNLLVDNEKTCLTCQFLCAHPPPASIPSPQKRCSKLRESPPQHRSAARWILVVIEEVIYLLNHRQSEYLIVREYIGTSRSVPIMLG